MRKILLGFLVIFGMGPAYAASLPLSKTFIGNDRFQSVMRRGVAENWAALPIGERTAKVGAALQGIPYKNYTLEINYRTESPCVNFRGMDCWTFFETALACARLLKAQNPPYTQQELLHMIEIDRYRGGNCNGKFVSRLHHLEDWSYDNQRRGLVRDITKDLGGVPLRREMHYMGSAWRQFPQLRVDPSQIDYMRNVEANLSRRGIYYIPKSRVPRIESKIQNGDIICIVTTWHGDYTSHVGLAYRDGKGTLRFLHASKNHKQVIIDSRLSDYLARYDKHQGIMVIRPNEA